MHQLNISVMLNFYNFFFTDGLQWQFNYFISIILWRTDDESKLNYYWWSIIIFVICCICWNFYWRLLLYCYSSVVFFKIIHIYYTLFDSVPYLTKSFCEKFSVFINGNFTRSYTTLIKSCNFRCILSDI